jgi:hypothetical protein
MQVLESFERVEWEFVRDFCVDDINPEMITSGEVETMELVKWR